tara:strand:- start:84 stop:335 length:252 start_codon:yes stop_codon:yes gene_type:complete
MSRTEEEIDRDYKALVDSANTIELAMGELKNKTIEEKKDIVKRNYEHIETVLKKYKNFFKTDWGSRDLTNVNKAVTDGKAYVG